MNSTTKSLYAVNGTKLRTIHRPASSTALTDSIDYIGNLILKNGRPSMYLFDGGYASFNANGAVDGWHYYIQDYMGNNRMVVNKNGTVEQVTHYYPYGGVIGDISTNESVQKYKFEGKELDRTFGLDYYDIHARQYFAMMPSWDRIDPLAEDTPQFSPYCFCMGNPISFVDYDGLSTEVEKIDSTHFKVCHVNLDDDDTNIYIVNPNESGGYERTGEILGQTPTITTFYNSDNNKCYGEIDTQDNSGNEFIEEINNDDPDFWDYFLNARDFGIYDFKVRGNKSKEEVSNEYKYRGMPITINGVTYIVSARDLGNIMAGAAFHHSCSSWIALRLFFDGYQTSHNPRFWIRPGSTSFYTTSKPLVWNVEGISSQNAQRFGFNHYKSLRK